MARRTRGTAAGLSRDQIVAAAVALVDRDGLDRFGVRRLADDLGVDPMSIYNHIRGKAALLDAISESVLAEAVSEIEGVSDSWEEIARRTAHAYRATAYRHPHVVPLLATRPQLSAPALTSLERLVTAIRAAGLPDQVASDAPMMLFSFLNGYLLAVLSGGPDGGPSVPPIDPGQYPALAQSIPAMADFGTASEFDRMLDAVLSGIRAQAAPPRAPRRQR